MIIHVQMVGLPFLHLNKATLVGAWSSGVFKLQDWEPDVSSRPFPSAEHSKQPLQHLHVWINCIEGIEISSRRKA